METQYITAGPGLGIPNCWFMEVFCLNCFKAWEVFEITFKTWEINDSNKSGFLFLSSKVIRSGTIRFVGAKQHIARAETLVELAFWFATIFNPPSGFLSTACDPSQT